MLMSCLPEIPGSKPPGKGFRHPYLSATCGVVKLCFRSAFREKGSIAFSPKCSSDVNVVEYSNRHFLITPSLPAEGSGLRLSACSVFGATEW